MAELVESGPPPRQTHSAGSTAALLVQPLMCGYSSVRGDRRLGQLVTGGASGIGFALGRIFAQAGMLRGSRKAGAVTDIPRRGFRQSQMPYCR
jgi:hypothetical protein